MKRIAMILGLFFTGCASTQTSYITDNTFSHGKYNKVMVIAEINNLNLMTKVEDTFCRNLEDQGVLALKGYNEISVLNTPSKEEMANIFKSKEVDAILQILFTGYSEEKTYVPGDSHTKGDIDTTATSLNFNSPVNQVTANTKYKSTTYNDPGYTLTKPRASFKCKLVDIKTGKTVFLSDSMSAGNAFADIDDLINSFSKQVVDNIIIEDFFKRDSN